MPKKHPKAPAKTTPAFWKQRLVQRPYRDSAAPPSAKAFSARVEHQGVAWYFPLGFADPRRAAERAAQIHSTVLRQGWPAAYTLFSRELTLAIHWAANPLVWTYATLYTRVERDTVRRAAFPESSSRSVGVALIEPDAGIRAALASCIDRHPGFCCAAAFESAKVALAGIASSPPGLVLLNHHLPDMEGPRFIERLRSAGRHGPCLLFSIYEDSGELFKSTPGGSAGYLLKRTAPEQLLAPINGIALEEPFSARKLTRRVWDYFQETLAPLRSGDAAAEMEKLTPRECQVLDCLSRGCVDKEIAATLGISAWTVHGHVKNIFEKLGVHSRTEAVVKYLQR